MRYKTSEREKLRMFKENTKIWVKRQRTKSSGSQVSMFYGIQELPIKPMVIAPLLRVVQKEVVDT